MSRKRGLTHYKNPKWDGPLCKYEIDTERRSCSPPLTLDIEKVTCTNCRQRLGLVKRTVDLTLNVSYKWLMKRKKEMAIYHE